MNHTYDVIVVGSGPAGSAAAWRLAQAGLHVAVIEKAPLPRYKTCGGGIIGRSWQALPIDVRQVIEQDCHTALLTVSDGLSFTTRRATAIVSMTMRDQFDYALLSAAQAGGAAVHQRCPVEGVSYHVDGVTVSTTMGEMKAKFVIAADGALGTVARKLGMPDGRILIPAMEWEVTVPPEELKRFCGIARFDFGLLSHGYAWAFPKRGHLSLGVLSMTPRADDLKAVMMRYLDLLGCRRATQIEQHGFVIPIKPRTGPFVDKRLLLVGDAAGFADPVTGEGISFALRTGQLAAQSLIDGNLEEQPVQQLYGRSLTESILPELRAGRLLARLLYDVPRLRAWAFSRYGQRLCEAVTDVMAGERRYGDLVSSPNTLIKRLTSSWIKKAGDRSA